MINESIDVNIYALNLQNKLHITNDFIKNIPLSQPKSIIAVMMR